jgi:translation initiation factor 4A
LDGAGGVPGPDALAAENAPDVFTGKERWTSFDDMGLSDNLLRGVYSNGFEHPSAVQCSAIVPIGAGRDVLAQAQSGTGKTATFCIGTIQQMSVDDTRTQVLILSPTRELARQTHDVFTSLASFTGLTSCCFRGGQRLQENMQTLRQRGGVHAAIGTPGRILDLINKGWLQTCGLRSIVVDEADEMLSAGFEEQMGDIFKSIPNDSQCVLVSATMPEECVRLASTIMKPDKINILIKRDEVTLEGIKQFYVGVEDESYKFDTLVDLYEAISVVQACIFVNNRRTADQVAQRLDGMDFAVSVMHGETPQEDRDRIMDAFRTGATRILLCSDVLARGIDVQQVSLVINYDIPHQKESYVHRVGRCGRYGRKGAAINFVTRRDILAMREIEQFYDTQIQELPADLNLGI